ncbi:hypothetical protein IFM89_023233 [Coptis chinensis]|uniref:Uncharacterized protein n=1 Tax=Coptis chinensis TaxID=261450 RepID=A0A835J049_9MAGN|nr:hypothetical protein IFM89_023233 [Coptis chinensis]
MQRVAQEKEEERRLEIEEIKRQAQEKDEQRRHEIDEMKSDWMHEMDMETRLMQKVANFAQMKLGKFQVPLISDCESLASLSGMRYLNLHFKTRDLARCEKMHIRRGDMDGLTSLRTLEIEEIPNLVSIPKGLRECHRIKGV